MLLSYLITIGQADDQCMVLRASESSRNPSQCSFKFSHKTIGLPWDEMTAIPFGKVIVKDPRGESTIYTFTVEDLKGKSVQQVLDDRVLFTNVGSHTLSFTGFSNNQIPDLRVDVIDDTSLSSTANCPTQLSEVPALTQESGAVVQELYSKFKSWYDGKKFGLCDASGGSSTAVVSITCLDGKSCDMADLSLKATAQDVTELRQISSTIFELTPGAPMEKCLHFDGRIIDRRNQYHCDGVDKVDQYLSCDLEQCFKMQGDVLYSAEIHSSSRKIHVQSTTQTLSVNLGSFLEVKLTAEPFFDQINTDRKAIEQIIKCRYRIPQAGIADWTLWDYGTSSNRVVLREMMNHLDLECWTILGKVSEGSFDIVLHRSTDSPVCSDFSARFSQSFAEKSGNIFCNVPGSSFADVNFDFPESAVCTAAYGLQDTSSFATPVALGSNHKSKTFAVQLLTPLITTVQFSCTFRYQGKFSRCEATIAFRTCTNAVAFDEGSIEDLETCTEVCNAKTQQINPFGYCGHNLISFTKQDGTSLNSPTGSCCTDCAGYYNSPFECSAIGSDPNSPVKRCQQRQLSFISNLIESIEIPPLHLCSFMIIAIAGMGIAYISLQDTYEEDEESYYDQLT